MNNPEDLNDVFNRMDAATPPYWAGLSDEQKFQLAAEIRAVLLPIDADYLKES